MAGSLLLLSAPARAAENPPTAAELYQNSCARCHGADGHNPRLQVVFPDLPDFTNAKWQAAHTAAEFKKVILNGGKDGMPAYRGDLQGLNPDKLVQYLRKFAQPAPADPAKAPLPPTVAEFFQNYCARCHGVDGHNPALQEVFPDLPDFTNAKWQAAHTAAEFKKVILHGGKDGMPAYQGDLQTITAGELVQYLRGFARPKPKH